MLPVARSALRRIGEDTDVVTFVSHYTRGRFASAFGPNAALEHLPPGVDTERFQPNPAAGPNCAAATAWASGRPSSVCPGWCRARARTCSSRRCPTSAAGSTVPAW